MLITPNCETSTSGSDRTFKSYPSALNFQPLHSYGCPSNNHLTNHFNSTRLDLEYSNFNMDSRSNGNNVNNSYYHNVMGMNSGQGRISRSDNISEQMPPMYNMASGFDNCTNTYNSQYMPSPIPPPMSSGNGRMPVPSMLKPSTHASPDSKPVITEVMNNSNMVNRTGLSSSESQQSSSSDLDHSANDSTLGINTSQGSNDSIIESNGRVTSDGKLTCNHMGPSTHQPRPTTSGSPVRKLKKRSLPEDEKDESYWEKRRKNNESARRSRENRKMKEKDIAFSMMMLKNENIQLRAELNVLKAELDRCRNIILTLPSHNS